MSKVAYYLQEHLLGEVMVSADARSHFSTDSSILTIEPLMIVYPRNVNDIRKTARFTWQLAERGRVISVTSRGSGTDQTGAAIGNGILLVYTAHMFRILELDSKSGVTIVEPGINFGKLQETLHTHGRFLPTMPSSGEYSTVGGAVANNSSSAKIFKYGDFNNYVRSLKIILANGEIITTERLSKKELNKKLGLSSFEGEIYRSLDALIEDEIKTIHQIEKKITKNNAGYNLLDIKKKDGSFDLTPLFIGSQGTLGTIAEITLDTEIYNPETVLLMATCDSVEQVQNIVSEVRDLSDMPSSVEIIDGNLLAEGYAVNPSAFKGLIDTPFPSFCLFVELDCLSEHLMKKTTKKIKKILDRHATNIKIATELNEQEKIWKIRDVSSYLISHNNGSSRALPLVGNGSVPTNKVGEFIRGIYQIFEKTLISPAIWGHVGDGIIHLEPRLDISQVGDRQKAFKLIDEYSILVNKLGGTISSEGNDGRLRTPYLSNIYSPEILELFAKVKKIFDPYNILNPGVKFSTTVDNLKEIMRSEYKLNHLHDHLPRN